MERKKTICISYKCAYQDQVQDLSKNWVKKEKHRHKKNIKKIKTKNKRVHIFSLKSKGSTYFH